MNEETGATPESVEPVAAPDTAAQDATPGDARVESGQRPEYVSLGEFKRNFGRLERTMNDVLQLVATQRQPQSQAQPQQEVTDEDLWRLAQQGDRSAFDLYMERKASRVSQAQMQTSQMERAINAQLAALTAKYPVLNDPNHPLTQTANQAYAVLLQQGFPANRATLLDAVKTAIADKDDLIADLRSQRAAAHGAVRQSAATRAQAGVTGASHRESPAPVRPGVRLTQEQLDIAKRMNVKDPAKAFEGFRKRRQEGTSRIGLVGNSLDDAEIGGA